MSIRIRVVTLGLSAFACSSIAVGQGASAPANGATSNAVSAPVGSAIMQLQLELDALNAMTDAMGPMRGDADARVAQMKAFISEEKLDAAAAAFATSAKAPAFNGLTFNQSLQVALKEQRTRGQPIVSNTDPAALQTEVNATQVLVQGQWGDLNKVHAQVAVLSGFLQSQKKLDAYHTWAAAAAAKRLASSTPDVAPTDSASSNPKLTPEQKAAKILAYQQQLVRLRTAWDQEQMAQGAANFPQSQSSGDQQGQSGGAGSSNYSGSGDNNSNYNNDYYSGSYWNGYADPYYDVWGAGRGAAAAAVAHNNWNRGGAVAPAIAPGAGHPRMGGFRR